MGAPINHVKFGGPALMAALCLAVPSLAQNATSPADGKTPAGGKGTAGRPSAAGAPGGITATAADTKSAPNVHLSLAQGTVDEYLLDLARAGQVNVFADATEFPDKPVKFT